uniref:Chromosome partition protein Smc n=1 Tax=uncultured Thiotrichaceae bacterium TaxID=298394 RepID=A0A6S6TLY3_9GAMM|nr:MAG: Unknown protein [uncultured Thiotrichaceae bacterium]
MSWGGVFHADEAEDSFWPSFTDIMMVIVMTFLLVTVAVVLANTRLLDELKSSVVAEEEAKQRIEFTLKENATLEEQLDYFQQRSSSLEMELLRSRAQTENTRSELLSTQSELSRLQSADQQKSDELADLEQSMLTQGAAVKRLETELQQSQQALVAERSQLQNQLAAIQEQLLSSQNEAIESEAALANLREQTSDESLKLASLQGEYDELDKKYQKLLKPTRSSKGKTVVDVMYSQSGYRIRKPGEAAYRTVGQAVMNRELAALKSAHGTDLYVKIIIPENSGLSYNKAWVFTRDILNKYDYYYQENTGAEGNDGE